MSVVQLERVQTARLLCERLAEDHTRELTSLFGDPRVARTATVDGLPESETVVAAKVRRYVAHWTRYGFGLWLLRDRASGAMVGRGGLQHTDVEGRDMVEIAWAIVPERWGEGLATELAHKSVEVAFGPLGLDELAVLTLTDNLPSRRVAEKAGFVYERDVDYVGLAHALYRLRRVGAG